MKLLFLFLLLLPCCINAQTNKASYNKDSTVYLTTTDPRITLEYIGTDTIQSPLAVHHKLHLWPFHRKKKQLILCGTFTHMEPYKQ